MGLLRVILALAVFNAHASCIDVRFGPLWLSPFMAVRAFYLISGFYMAMVIAKSYSRIPNGSKRFYLNRFVRLYPVYIAVLVPSILLQLTGQFDTHVEFLWSGSKAYSGTESLAYSLVSFANDVLLVPAPFYVTVYGTSLRPPLSGDMLIVPAYTVGVEVLFYALAPMIVTRGWKFLAALFAIALGLHLAPAAMGLPWRPFQYDFFPGVLVFFVAGVIAYRGSVVAAPLLAQATSWIRRAQHPLVAGEVLVAYALIVAFVGATIMLLPWQESGTNNLPSLIFYLAVAAITPVAFHLTSRSNIDRFLGDLSYPLYIVHFPVLLWAANLQIDRDATRNLVVLAVVGVMTVALTLFIERPLQAVRSRNRTGEPIKTGQPAPAQIGQSARVQIAPIDR